MRAVMWSDWTPPYRAAGGAWRSALARCAYQAYELKIAALVALALTAQSALLTATTPAVAGTKNMTGPADGCAEGSNWSNASCWVGSVVPVTGDDVVLDLTTSGDNAVPSTSTYNLGAGVQLHSITINSANNNLTISGGPISLQSGASITDNFNNAGNDLVPSITLNGSTTFSLTAGTEGLHLTGAITGTGPVTLSNTGLTDGLQLLATNTYSGATTIAGTSEVAAFGNGAIPTTSAVTVNSGAALVFTASSTIGSLAGGGTVSMQSSGALTVGGDNSSTTFSGIYQASGGGSPSLVKVGTGTFTLSGANTYSGGTTVSGGTLQGTTTSLQGNITNNAAVVFNQSSNGTYSGIMSGSGTLTLSGTGTVTLSGSNTYTGATTVSAGTLQAGAANALSSSSAISVSSGATLSLNNFSQTVGGLSGAGNLSLGTGTLTVDQSGNSSFSGAVSGSGSLAFGGSGTVALTGNNSGYSGTTVITSGLVNFASLTQFGSGTITLNGGGLQWASGNTTDVSGRLNAIGAGGATFDTNGNTVTFATGLSGAGGVTKAGGGTLILDGANTYTGGTTVSGGTLEVGDAGTPGASLAGNVTVDSGATLAGHGTITGNVGNSLGGTVSPGGTIGTLSIGGNYTQGSTSTLSIEVSPTAASKLNVTGTASLAGTLALVYDPGVYSKTTYDILHAGSVTGTFSTVSGTAPSGFAQSLSYSATDVDLSIDPTTVAPTNDAAFTALGTAALMGAQQANATLLGHLAGLANGSETIHTAFAATAPTTLAMGGGAESLAGVLPTLPEAVEKQGGWFRGIGDFARLDGNAAAPGFHTQAGGFLAGIDRPLGDNLTAGIAGGYTRTNVTVSDGESGTLDTPRLMLYGSYRCGRWGFDATAGYAYDRIDAARPISSLGETASSAHDGHEATGALQARTRYVLGGVTFVPAVGLDYVHLFETAFAESGAPGFDLAVSSRNADSLRPFLGASAAKAFTTAGGTVLVPEADLGYSHELLNTAPASLVQVGGGSFAVAGIVPSRDTLTLGGGLTATMSDRLALYADYHATLPTGNLFEQTVSAGLRYRF